MGALLTDYETRKTVTSSDLIPTGNPEDSYVATGGLMRSSQSSRHKG